MFLKLAVALLRVAGLPTAGFLAAPTRPGVAAEALLGEGDRGRGKGQHGQ